MLLTQLLETWYVLGRSYSLAKLQVPSGWSPSGLASGQCPATRCTRGIFFGSRDPSSVLTAGREVSWAGLEHWRSGREWWITCETDRNKCRLVIAAMGIRAIFEVCTPVSRLTAARPPSVFFPLSKSAGHSWCFGSLKTSWMPATPSLDIQFSDDEDVMFDMILSCEWYPSCCVMPPFSVGVLSLSVVVFNVLQLPLRALLPQIPQRTSRVLKYGW